MFLGGPPLVKMATGEESDDESLGGAEMHARISGLADYLAEDERDAIRIGRRIVARLNWRKARSRRARPTRVRGAGRRPRRAARPDPDRPQGAVRPARGDRAHLRRRWAGQRRPFDEFKPLYGSSLVTGWARLHGRPIGILANAQGVLFSEEAQKATQFIQLANQVDTPLLFLHNTTGYMVGAEYEQGGIIKHGAQMINAVCNSHGPAPERDHGRVVRRRQLRHERPRLRPALPVHLAQREVRGDGPGPAGRRPLDRRARGGRGAGAGVRRGGRRRACAAFVEAQVEEQALPFFLSGMLYDDGVIDPRDTRTVLGHLPLGDREPPYRGRRAATGCSGVDSSSPRRGDEPWARRRRCSSPTGPRSRAGLPHLPRRSASRRSPSTPTPTPALPYVREADVAVRLPGNTPGRDLPRTDLLVDAARRSAPTRSTPATASCPRTPTSPAR